MEVKEIFTQRVTSFQSSENEYQKKYNQISIARLSVFLLGLTVFAFCFFKVQVLYGTLFFAICMLPFIWLVKRHHKINYSLHQFSFLKKINLQELQRLDGNYLGLDEGKQFIDPLHPYISDLDVFGSNSLFQLLNRCSLTDSKKQLASWLKSPADKKTIDQRQQAMKELAVKIDWRQNFQATGMHLKSETQGTRALTEWVALNEYILDQKTIKILTYLLAVFTPLAIIFSWFFLPGWVALVFFAANGFLLKKFHHKISETAEKTEHSAQLLNSYSNLIEAIELEDFESEKLKLLKSKIKKEHSAASAEIKKLSKIMAALEYRKNMYFYLIVNGIFLWDLLWLMKLERWKKNISSNIEQWFETINEFEALNSLAGLHYANSAWVIPKISDRPFSLEAKDLAHPLIKEKNRTSNDIIIDELGQTIIITGSNMSGKSTFLRTVGINAVLCMTGAPVAAREFSMSIMEIFTSMRTNDSLEENTSSFYAELKRLKQLIESVSSSKPTLFLLDEILKGTNSQDRHLGAQALIRQLQKRNASGIVSTHDLELGKMENENPAKIKNYSFNSDLKNNELYFDYKLRKGICNSFNASELMRRMGIEL